MNDEFQNLPPTEQKAVMDAVKQLNRSSISNPSLHTLSMSDLYDIAFPPKCPIIEGLLYSDAYIFGGSPKIGKSFFMTQLGYHVATGTPLWGYPVKQGAVLYLALEDDYGRLQGRLNRMFGVDTVASFYFAVQAKTLAEGLNEQLEEFLAVHPDTKLIIVDTLQKIREIGNESYSYAMDYQTATEVKRFSDAHNVAVIVVHHTRKMEAGDVFDMISGTNGLLGAADGAFVLQKKKRTDQTATMQVVGRDQPDMELTLRFDQERCIWEMEKAETQPIRRTADPFVQRIADFMKDRPEWTGTATDLLALLGDTEMKPQVLTRKLNVNVSALYNNFGILYEKQGRCSDRRAFTLATVPVSDLRDGMTINDGILHGAEASPIPSQRTDDGKSDGNEVGK